MRRPGGHRGKSQVFSDERVESQMQTSRRPVGQEGRRTGSQALGPALQLNVYPESDTGEVLSVKSRRDCGKSDEPMCGVSYVVNGHLLNNLLKSRLIGLQPSVLFFHRWDGYTQVELL